MIQFLMVRNGLRISVKDAFDVWVPRLRRVIEALAAKGKNRIKSLCLAMGLRAYEKMCLEDAPAFDEEEKAFATHGNHEPWPLELGGLKHRDD